jgi:hypothetical protein
VYKEGAAHREEKEHRIECIRKEQLIERRRSIA